MSIASVLEVNDRKRVFVDSLFWAEKGKNARRSCMAYI